MKNSRLLTLSVALLGASLQASAATHKAVNVTGSYANMKYSYWEYLPDAYYSSSTSKLPLLIFLHGIGERGTSFSNIGIVKRNGPPNMIDHLMNNTTDPVKWDKTLPFIVISPQHYKVFDPITGKDKQTGWFTKGVDALIESIKAKYPTRIDTNRIYITGLSMGGLGTYNYMTSGGHKKIAASVIMCAKSAAANLCDIKDVPIWHFHGVKDPISATKYYMGKDTIDRINACLPTPDPLAKLTTYPSKGHDIWKGSYEGTGYTHVDPVTGKTVLVKPEESVFRWLLRFKNSDKTIVANKAPSVAAVAPVVMMAGDTKSVAIKATDPEGQTLTLSASGLPAFATFSSSGGNGTLILKPANNQAGNYSVSVKARDSAGAYSVAISISIQVDPPANRAPTLEVLQPRDGDVFDVDMSYTIKVEASDVDGNFVEVKYFVDGRQIGRDLAIAGVEAYGHTLGASKYAVGSHVIKVIAVDSAGLSTTKSVTIQGR